jgi:hypothetical protein
MPIDDAAEPLIASERISSEHDTEHVLVNEASKAAPGLFVWALTLTAALSGLLFGYEYVASADLGVLMRSSRCK